jgi:hypothetical protein
MVGSLVRRPAVVFFGVLPKGANRALLQTNRNFKLFVQAHCFLLVVGAERNQGTLGDLGELSENSFNFRLEAGIFQAFIDWHF